MQTKKRKNRKRPAPGDVGVIYARYSSHNQKDASIEQQVDECQKYAAGMGLQIVEVYAGRAVSGKTDKRPAFQKLLRDAEKCKFQYVVAWKSNRIGRNMLQAMVNEARLDEFGVVCLYVEEDFDDTAAGRFALRSMMNVNQFYIENMAEDIRRGMMDNEKTVGWLAVYHLGTKAVQTMRLKLMNRKLPLSEKSFSEWQRETTTLTLQMTLTHAG